MPNLQLTQTRKYEVMPSERIADPASCAVIALALAENITYYTAEEWLSTFAGYNVKTGVEFDKMQEVLSDLGYYYIEKRYGLNGQKTVEYLPPSALLHFNNVRAQEGHVAYYENGLLHDDPVNLESFKMIAGFWYKPA